MAASPLRLGEPVELLTNYKCKYESVRERKGYGLRSINKGLCSDVIPAARMLRNFNERENVEWVVGMTMTDSIQRLCYLLRFVQTKIWKPLSAKIWQFNHSRESGSKCDPPTTLQWVASKRVVWLCHHIRQKLENFSGHDKSLFQFYEYKMNQCLDKIFREAYDCAVRSMVTHELGKEATEALEFENTEEGCYQIHDNLLMPLDSSLYCRIGSELIKTLCGLVDKLQFTEDKIIGPPKTEILKSFYDAAIGAKAEIWASIATGEFANLQFSPGVSPKSSLLSGSIGGVLKELRSSNAFFLQNSSAPKGVVAAAMRMLHYQDASILAGIEFDALTVPFPISEQVVMLRYDGVSQPIDLKGLGSIPVGIATMQQGAEINDMWYVATQVVWIVDVFAKHYLKGSGYSLVALCNVLDADKSHANFVTQRGLEKYDTYRFQDFLTRLDEVKAASCTDASLASARNPAKVNRKTQHKKSSKKSSKLVNIGPPTTTKVKTNANKKSSRLPPNRVYRGPPTSAYPAGGEWPAEWIQEIYERRGGASKGHQDSYWFPPSGKPKLRSTIDILRYLNSGSKDSFKSA